MRIRIHYPNFWNYWYFNSNQYIMSTYSTQNHFTDKTVEFSIQGVEHIFKGDYFISTQGDDQCPHEHTSACGIVHIEELKYYCTIEEDWIDLEETPDLLDTIQNIILDRL